MTRKEAQKESVCNGKTANHSGKMIPIFDEKMKSKLIDNIYNDFEARVCGECKYRDSKRPHSHPNYRECTNEDSPLHYEETHFGFGCNKWKQNA